MLLRLQFALICTGMLLLPVLSFAVQTPSSLLSEPQQRDDYHWLSRHNAVLERHTRVKPDVVFIGDSITHHWGGEPKGARVVSQASWDSLFKGMCASNLGFGFDYVDNAFYRVQQGELDGISPRLILVNVGTNNLGFRGDSPEGCAANIAALVALIREKQPQAKILLIGIYPRREVALRSKIAETNARIQQLENGDCVRFIDLGSVLAGKDGLANPALFRDTVHPNAKGYEVLAKALRPYLEQE